MFHEHILFSLRMNQSWVEMKMCASSLPNKCVFQELEFLNIEEKGEKACREERVLSVIATVKQTQVEKTHSERDDGNNSRNLLTHYQTT